MIIEYNPDVYQQILVNHNLKVGITALIVLDAFHANYDFGEYVFFDENDFDLNMLKEWESAGFLELSSIGDGNFKARINKEGRREYMRLKMELEGVDQNLEAFEKDLEEAFKD